MENKIKTVKVIAGEKPDMSIASFEDTYVLNGQDGKPMSCADMNFGGSDTLHFKGNDNSGCLSRRVLLKFDISELEGRDFVRASLCLKGIGAQQMPVAKRPS